MRLLIHHYFLIICESYFHTFFRPNLDYLPEEKIEAAKTVIEKKHNLNPIRSMRRKGRVFKKVPHLEAEMAYILKNEQAKLLANLCLQRDRKELPVPSILLESQNKPNEGIDKNFYVHHLTRNNLGRAKDLARKREEDLIKSIVFSENKQITRGSKSKDEKEFIKSRWEAVSRNGESILKACGFGVSN